MPSTCYWVHIHVLWSSFPLHWKPNILLANYDSWWQQQMSLRELRHDRPSGWFSKFWVCLQVFPSFIPHPLPALLQAPFFARSSTLTPLSLLLNRTETLATQAIRGKMKNGYIWENKQETIAGVIKLISYNLAIKFDCNQSNLIAGRINSGIYNSSLKGSGEILNNITCVQL